MSRRLKSLVAMTTLLAVVAVPAGAAETPEEYQARGTLTGIDLRLPAAGDFLKFALADALGQARTAPQSSASATGLDAVGDTVSTASATDGQNVRDPGADQNCATPTLPAPLGNLVNLGAACSSALAQVLAGLPTATGSAEVGSLVVNGGFLADALIGLVLEPLDNLLGPALTTVEDTVLDPVIDVVQTACNTALAALNLDLLPDLPLPDLLGPVTDAIDALPLDSQEACVILLDIIVDPPIVGPVPDVIDRIAGILEAALDQDLVVVQLGSGVANVTTTGGQSVATVSGSGVTISLPSLAFLTDLLNEVVGDLLDEFVGTVEDLVAPVAGAIDAIPVIGPILAGLLGDLELPLLTDEPLLTLQLAASSATATYNRNDGTSSGSGTPGTVVLTLNSALAALLGLPATTNVPAGQSLRILEGTPLESAIDIGTATITDDTVDGLPGTTARVSGIRLELFSGLQGGIVADIAGVTAAARGVQGVPAQPVNPDNPEPVLPTTGGGFAILAAGLALAATGLRRRH